MPDSSNDILITRINTPLGTMVAGGVEQGICLLEFEDRASLQKEISALTVYLNSSAVEGISKYTPLLINELELYFKGSLKTFSVPLVAPGTDFQIKVWNALKEIPYGETRSYSFQSEMIGSVKSVRAVANANGQNRISILIPCHRVIGSNGNLTGYGGGLHRKKWLLELESKNSNPKTPLNFT